MRNILVFRIVGLAVLCVLLSGAAPAQEWMFRIASACSGYFPDLWESPPGGSPIVCVRSGECYKTDGVFEWSYWLTFAAQANGWSHCNGYKYDPGVLQVTDC